MGTIAPSKFCTLSQLERIQSNNYLSEDCLRDYDADLIDMMIIEKRSKYYAREHERQLREMAEMDCFDLAIERREIPGKLPDSGQELGEFIPPKIKEGNGMAAKKKPVRHEPSGFDEAIKRRVKDDLNHAFDLMADSMARLKVMDEKNPGIEDVLEELATRRPNIMGMIDEPGIDF